MTKRRVWMDSSRVVADMIRSLIRDGSVPIVPHQLEGSDFMVEWNGRLLWVSVRQIDHLESS